MSTPQVNYASLEAERRKILRFTRIPKIIAVFLLLGSIALFLSQLVLYAAILTALAVGLLIQSELPKKKFLHNFKLKVIGTLAQQINPTFTYEPDKGWDVAFLYENGLTHLSPTGGKSEDYFSGSLDQTKIAFCEMTAFHRDSGLNETGQRRTAVKNLFKGIVFQATFPQSFVGQTFVIPRDQKSDFDAILKEKLGIEELKQHAFDLLKEQGAEVNLVVYSSDESAANNIFSTSFKKLVIELYHKLENIAPCHIYMTFKDQNMYLAIDWESDFFEYSIQKTVEEEIEETMAELQLCFGIIEDLNLNQQVWSAK